MMKAWAVRNPRARTLLLAAASAPLVAALGYELSTQASPAYSVQEAAGLALVLLAYEAFFGWVGLGQFLLSRNFVLFLVKTFEAIAGGLGLAWLSVLALPYASPGYVGAALVGAGSAGVLLVLWAFLRLAEEPRPMTDGVLVLGREDLGRNLCRDLIEHRATSGSGAVPMTLEPEDAGVTGLAVDADELKDLVRRHRISRIVVVEPDADLREEITGALLECRLLGVEVEDGLELYQRLHGKLWLEALDPRRLVFSDGFRITPAYRFVKRIVDVACAVLVLVVAAPVMAVIALVIKLESPGPVLFRQERVGQHGRPFTLLKFRSMRRDAEDGTGPTWARENDDRVTRVGRFLRRSHLDELPQVFNVLRGDVSFVGPRPERPEFVEMLRREIPYYDLRHYVKPGITGWAQVRFPYAGSVEDSYEKLQYDLYYARNASFLFDLKVLLRTAGAVVTGGGR